jgi:predicted acylesterase/phospholipase RssA
MVPNHPVLLELKSRLHGQRDPSHRLALSVEGGSVRGVVSAAMLEVLTEAGFNGAIFDEVYGSSAGAVNAAAYLTGNTRPHNYSPQSNRQKRSDY